MLRVILVDDEPNVRQGIKMMIPWDELDLTVIAEAEDGDDGLNKLIELQPDIVIADVKMPGMTGIKMLEEAKAKGFSGKAIIVSGYSDFTYAQEAITLGVKKFVLKPVDEDELIEALKIASKEIEGERESEFKLEKGTEYINSQLIKSLLLGDSDMSEALLGFDYESFTVSIAEFEPQDDSDERIEGIISRFIQDFGGENAKVESVSLYLNCAAILFMGCKRNKITESLSALAKEYQDRIFITVGRTVGVPSDISKSYASANELYKSKFLYLHYGVITEKTGKTPDSADDLESVCGQIFAYIEINDIPKLELSIELFRNSLINLGYAPERIKLACITAVTDVKYRVTKSLGDKKDERFDLAINKIGEAESLYEIIEMMKNVFVQISNAYFEKTTKSAMERVVKYIEANYDQELRLEILANIFGYNSAYLGKVFHQYTGENFNNYIDRIRINEAKRLLSMEEYKVYEVGEMVGYGNINYFHNKFKKYVGVSPLSYKKSVKNAEEN